MFVRRVSALVVVLASCGDSVSPDGAGGAPQDAGTSSSLDGGSDGSDGAAPSGPYGLLERVDQARYLADLTTIAKPRLPDSPHWKEVQDLCAARFAQYGYVVELHDYGTGVNVLGVKAGSSPDAHQVVIGAHYDSVADCPGADDNGSGVAGTLEAARVLSMMTYPQTLVVACWDEEEKGLIGSKAHAERAAGAGTKIDAVFDLEMIGYKDDAEGSQTLPPGFGGFFPEAAKRNEDNGQRANFIAAAGNAPAAPQLGALQAYSDRIGLLFVPLQLTEENISSPFLADLHRSDHAPFWKHGYSAMMITDTSNFRYDAYHCKNGKVDEIGRLDHAFATQVIKATVGAAAETLGLARDL
ncbi:MAG TPA: M20/M25/M40 family metallo-hydrolase [Labilithrix sp.]|nr:M20/M25/M40 family metallo-hydrolase [Labilithrix sp.]